MKARKVLYVYKVMPLGDLSFPTDMLRRDNSWPYTTDDAVKLSATCANAGEFREIWGPNTTITLVTHLPIGTHGRWDSFGWRVIAV